MPTLRFHQKLTQNAFGAGMPNYRRMYVSGGTYFFTVRLADPKGTTLVQHVTVLKDCFRKEIRQNPFSILDCVVLPDHLHAIWKLPENDSDFSSRWGRIKSNFTKSVSPVKTGSLSKTIKREAGLWQRRFWERYIRNQGELDVYRYYCWNNPVKHGYVDRAVDWPHSSFHRAVAHGRVSADWRLH